MKKENGEAKGDGETCGSGSRRWRTKQQKRQNEQEKKEEKEEEKEEEVEVNRGGKRTKTRH